MIGNQDHHEDEWPKQDNNSIPSSNNSETTSKHSECYRKIPLFLFIMAYISFCCLGALCLTLLERPTERVERLRLHASQINFLRTNPCVSSEELQKFVSYIVSATKMGISMTPIKNISKYDLLSIPENWHENFYSETNIEVNAQLESIARRILTEEEMNNSSWNFYESVFFVITVITTIGYGTISPVTIYGKAFCIFLVTVGIPMNVILVSVLASLCMPVIRKSRNALVNFYSYSSGHDTHNNKHNKNSKHSNFNFFNERRKFMEDANLRLNNENHNRVSKLFFKLKSLFGRHINAPDKRCESSVLHRSLSDSRLSNSIVKNNPRSTVCNITDPKNVTEGEELSNKTASLTSLSTSLSTNKIQSQSSLAIKTGDYPNDFNGGENDLDISKLITCSILIPGIIFTYLEQNWTYFDAIYFCIISLSAVGFGDMVASESKDSNVSSIVTILYVKNIYRVMTAIYLVLGTTLIAVLVRSFQEIIDYEFLNVTGGYYDEKFGEHIAQNPCSELFFDDTTPSQNRKSQLKHRDIG
ncbi:unnamed protein product [Schistosoma rodhaini]|uniref:Potassium channel domain-containing protein n=1 Tax=Schistosoma rodhaini TaxID=6188 RepID=A0AA85EQV6_9TREM|nr:unnamed protein product [Schistosoma rodhaini]CAH8682181.1 unnamed protein product [Schistosoma rodhaini]